jgi:hypothetical protein
MAASMKTTPQKADTAKKATGLKIKSSRVYQVFDSPLEPTHFSVKTLRQVAKKG